MTLDEALLTILKLQARVDELEFQAGYWETSYYNDIVAGDPMVYLPTDDIKQNAGNSNEQTLRNH